MPDSKELEKRIKMRMAEAHYAKLSVAAQSHSEVESSRVAQKIHRRRKIFLWIGALLFLAILVVRVTRGALHR